MRAVYYTLIDIRSKWKQLFHAVILLLYKILVEIENVITFWPSTSRRKWRWTSYVFQHRNDVRVELNLCHWRFFSTNYPIEVMLNFDKYTWYFHTPDLWLGRNLPPSSSLNHIVDLVLFTQSEKSRCLQRGKKLGVLTNYYTFFI